METAGIDKLNGNPKNPRMISKHDFEALKKSIQTFGDLSGIIYNIQTKQLAGGHQRVQAFKAMGGQKQVVITNRFETKDAKGTVALGYIDFENAQYSYREVDWTPEFETAANIAANRISGDWDQDLLAQINYELSQLENGAELLGLTGQTQDELDKLMDLVGANGEGNPEDDEAPEVDEVNPPVSKLGEIYQLGQHRLMCGDSTNFGAVSDLMNGAIPNMVWTDPPYNAAFNGRSGNHEVIMNDEMKPEEFKAFLQEFAQNLYAIAPEAAKYICTDWKVYPLMFSLMQKPSALIVWVKNMFGMGNGYRHQHELIIFEGSLEANDQSDVWEIKRDNGAEYEHPTQKPVELPRKAILNSTSRGGVVLDFFSGSGSALIAAETSSRIFYGMELDPKYCDVIRKRYAKHIEQDDWVVVTPVVQSSEDEASPDPATTTDPPIAPTE